jgi:cell division protein FtsB
MNYGIHYAMYLAAVLLALFGHSLLAVVVRRQEQAQRREQEQRQLRKEESCDAPHFFAGHS